MLPINWASLDGELVERFVSILLLREFPDANRRRTTQGDGGIDVIVPVSDNPPRYDVYQIKKYHEPLKSDQKNKIKRSAQELLKMVREQELGVREWNLTLPIDQADGEQQWIDDLFEGSGIRARWKGISHLEGLASKYRDVVDYYLFAGQERVQELVKTALDLAKLQSGGETGLDIDSMYRSIRSIYDRLNTVDPHFSYDIAMMHSRPREFSAPEGVVMSQFVGEGDGPTLRIDVFARHRYALEERPITTRVRFVVPNDEAELQEAIERFDIFGEDLLVPEGFAEVAIDDPLSGALEAQPMTVKLTSPQAEHDRRLRLLISSPSGERIASSFFTVYRVNQGPSGKGLVVRMRSDGGLIELTQEAVRDSTETFFGTLHFHLEWVDKVAARLLPDVRFGKELHGDRRLVMAQEFSGPCTEFASLSEINESPLPSWLVDYVEALAELQEYADTPLRTRRPANENDPAEINLTLLVASVLHGNSISQNSDQIGMYLEGVEYEQVVELVNSTGKYSMRTAFNVQIAGEEVTIPNAYFWANDVKARIGDNDGAPVVILSPASEGGTVTMHTVLEKFMRDSETNQEEVTDAH